MKILLVDDDPFTHFLNEKLISGIITDPNLEIISFYKANRALAYNLQHIRSDSNENLYIFLDLSMPEFSGFDFLDGLEEFYDGRIIVFILTSSISLQEKEKALEYKTVQDYIVKPLTKSIINKIFNYNRLNSIVSPT